MKDYNIKPHRVEEEKDGVIDVYVTPFHRAGAAVERVWGRFPILFRKWVKWVFLVGFVTYSATSFVQMDPLFWDWPEGGRAFLSVASILGGLFTAIAERLIETGP